MPVYTSTGQGQGQVTYLKARYDNENAWRHLNLNVSKSFEPLFVKLGQSKQWFVCDRYWKFCAHAARCLGNMVPRKNWGRLTPPPQQVADLLGSWATGRHAVCGVRNSVENIEEIEMMLFVLQRRWVAIRLPRWTVMTSVIFCKLVKDLGYTGNR